MKSAPDRDAVLTQKWKEGMERDGVSRWTRALYRWRLMTVVKKNLKQEFLKLES